jgi:hypothetical protein
LKLEPGTVIDRYRVEEAIGRGGMARVYRVRHTTLDTTMPGVTFSRRRRGRPR